MFRRLQKDPVAFVAHFRKIAVGGHLACLRRKTRLDKACLTHRACLGKLTEERRGVSRRYRVSGATLNGHLNGTPNNAQIDTGRRRKRTAKLERVDQREAA